MALSRFRVVGTLNVYDKVFLFKLGDTLKRRFTFIEITTTNGIFDRIADRPERFVSLCDCDETVFKEILEIFRRINSIKSLGVGILKEIIEYGRYVNRNLRRIVAIAANIVPFFEK